jgi:protein-disulfide isomerase
VKQTIALVGLALGLWAAACSAQTESLAPVPLTITPVMVKGPASAPVTIVEFSDYQ